MTAANGMQVQRDTAPVDISNQISGIGTVPNVVGRQNPHPENLDSFSTITKEGGECIRGIYASEQQQLNFGDWKRVPF